MQVPNFHTDAAKNARRRLREAAFTMRFWLGWLLLVLGLAWAIHVYFEHRNHELDKRLERLRTR